jgi:hypothetical protein
VQSKAVEAMIKRNDASSVRYLLEIMQDESEQSRRGAVEVLNVVGDTNAIKDLLVALKDKDWWVRARAADALGAIGGPKVIDAVLELLSSEDEFLRRSAVEILNTAKDPRAFEHLLAASADPDWWVRERAIDALASLRDKRAVPYLVRLLDADEKTAQASIRALRAIGDPQAVEPLLAKLSSTDDLTQREAIEALAALATGAHADAVANGLRRFVPATTAGRDSAANLARRLRMGPLEIGGTSPTARAAASGPQPTSTGDTPVTPVMTTPQATLVLNPVSRGKELEEQAVRASISSADDATLDLRPIRPGEVLGSRYKIIQTLGHGAFGQVLLVEDQLVGVEIALKLLHPRLLQEETVLARFIHEVRYARKISHENVIRIYDFFTLGPFHAISMEYFPSEPLGVRIRNGLHKQPVLGITLVRSIARAIEVAHRAGVIHRDLKPGNVLVNEQHFVKLVDFGVSALTSQEDTRLTRTGLVLGTPAYMSPEQARGVTVDARSDIYSLGVMMYEVFTGTVPYTADHPLGVVLKHLDGDKDPPRKRNPAIPAPLEAIILKAMALSPDERYQTATDLLADVEGMFSRGKAA